MKNGEVGSVFSKIQVVRGALKTHQGSRLFRSIVEVNPDAAMNGLEIAFPNYDTELIKDTEEGRRNLVWALEKLCFRENLFARASRMMGAFAVAEVEDYISNNATGQFIHLFQIQLPATQASLKVRFETLLHFTKSDKKQEIELGIKALQRALKTDHFTRMGGAEDQGNNVTLKDYQPSGREIMEYWRSVLEEFSSLMSHDDVVIAAEARKGFLRSFGNLMTVGGFRITLPYVERLKELSLEEWKEVRGVLLRVNKYHVDKLKSDEKIELQNLIDKFSPHSLQELYLNFVGQPSYEDISDDENYHEKARLKAVGFAETIFKDKSIQNSTLFDLLYNGEQQFGFYFGTRYGELLGDKKVEFIHKSVEYLGRGKDRNTNVTVLAGILSVLDDDQVDALWDTIMTKLKGTDVFWLFSVSKVSYNAFINLIDYSIKNAIDVKLFLNFKFGRGLEHLPDSNIAAILEKLAAISLEAKAITLSLAYYLQYNNKSRADFAFNYIKSLMSSINVLLVKDGYLDAHVWQESAQKIILNYNPNDNLQREITRQIVEYCADGSRILSNCDIYIKNLLSFLVQKYFADAWAVISGALEIPINKSFARYNLKHLLESDMGLDGNEHSILFEIPKENFEQILAWCRENPENNAPIVAEMVLLYQSDGKQFSWHPYALQVLNEFGKIDAVRRSMAANFGSYGWSGSIVPLLDRQRRMFQELKSHATQEVVEWAKKYLEYLEKEIKTESYQDEEWGK